MPYLNAQSHRKGLSWMSSLALSCALVVPSLSQAADPLKTADPLKAANALKAQAPASVQIHDLDDLLSTVRQQQRQDSQLNRQREKRFIADKSKQQRLLNKAKADFKRLQQRNNPLLAKTQAGAARIENLQQALLEQSRDLGDVYSTFNEFAGDFQATALQSMISAQLPQRQQAFAALDDKERLASIDDMRALWLLVQEEMTEAGKISRFDSPVVGADGSISTRSILRLGPFTAVSTAPNEGPARFLRFVPETAELLDLNRQPASSLREQAAHFAASPVQMNRILIDPSQGSLLGVMTHTPTTLERIEQGGIIGRIILALGALGLLLTLWRVAYLATINLHIAKQLRSLHEPRANNPLGRVMLSIKGSSLETALEQASVTAGKEVQYKLDEAVLAEVPSLERSHSFIKLLAATSPLLGLLGTVTGMILTFQAISLYGSGDPKLMANGISQALVTTVLGLVVAIPLLFGHNFVSALAKSLIQRLDEQSAGIMAKHMEQQRGGS